MEKSVFSQVYGVLPYFANVRQLAEISTPLVNQRSVKTISFMYGFIFESR